MTAQERELCATARLLPAHLLSLKAALLRAGAARGGILREDVASLFRLEPVHALRAYDLCVAAGWLRSGPAANGQEVGSVVGLIGMTDPGRGAAAPGDGALRLEPPAAMNGGGALAHAASSVGEALRRR